MPEGWCLTVKGDTQTVRLFLLQQFEKDIQKAVDGIGRGTVPGGEHTDTVKGAVDDGVAVDDHEFHGDPSCMGIIS
jgi:hypothetical protein